ncbi:MAG: hypothetical protein Q8P24_15645 [Desulfobacterales bacterium]|nr:hypothetical protein [Desulfobacterales bacterium]
MKTKGDLAKQNDQYGHDDLTKDFRNFPHLMMLTLWFCAAPVIMIIVAWIWGFREAMIASFIILVIMIGICQTFCLTGKRKKEI